MRKSISLLLVLGLSGGLMAAALMTSAQARTPDPVATSVDSFDFRDGKFVGKLSADRRLCLNGRDVTIFKILADGKDKVVTAELNFRNWSDNHKASFSKRHPAMDIERRRARLRALRGDYLVKLDPSPVFEYGKNFTCLGATDKLHIDA